MLIKIPRRECEKIVVGGNLSALLYSYFNEIPLVINKTTPPHRFELFQSSNALELWNKLFFALSALGLNLAGERARMVRVKENEVNIPTLGARTLKLGYEKLIIFDDENVSGLPLPAKENNNFVVLDWMISRSCEKHEHTFLDTLDELVNKVHFYPTDRVDGYHPTIKDMVAISYLNEEQLNDFEYSDTYAKFKVIKMLKDLGIKGSKSGATNYALKVEVEKREIRKAKMNLYENTERLKFKYEAPTINSAPPHANKINELLQVAV